MWEKLLINLIVSLLMVFKDKFVAWYKKRQAEGKTNKEIDDSVNAVETSTTKEEQREALKKHVQGIRRRRAA